MEPHASCGQQVERFRSSTQSIQPSRATSKLGALNRYNSSSLRYDFLDIFKFSSVLGIHMMQQCARLKFVTAVSATVLLGFCPIIAQQPSGSDRVPADTALKTIRPEMIRAHIRFIADSLLQGRAPGTPGYEIAARYVATQLE